MIIDFDHNPNATQEQKLQSLKESVQMALNEEDSKRIILKTYINNVSGERLPISGGTLYGNLKLRTNTTIAENKCAELAFHVHQIDHDTDSTSFIRVYDDHDSYNYGSNMVISPGSNMFIGSGEGPQNHYNQVESGAAEDTYITSDAGVYIQSNSQSIANRAGMLINSSHQIVPTKADVPTNNIGYLGTSAYRWAGVRANDIWGLDVTAGLFTANTAQSKEFRVNCQGGAGKLYMYAQSTTTGSVGLYAFNADGTTGQGLLNVAQDGRLRIATHYVNGNIYSWETSAFNVKSDNYGLSASLYRSYGLRDKNNEAIGNFEFLVNPTNDTAGWRCLVRNWNKGASTPAYTGWRGITCDVKRDGTTATSLITNTFSVSGSLTINGHSSAIGTIKNAHLSAAKSVATGTGTMLCSLSLEAGTWLINAFVRVPTNSVGARVANISTTSGDGAYNVSVPAMAGANINMHFSQIVQPTSTTTYYLNVFQNSGSTLSYPAGWDGGANSMRAVRIA